MAKRGGTSPGLSYRRPNPAQYVGTAQGFIPKARAARDTLRDEGWKGRRSSVAGEALADMDQFQSPGFATYEKGKMVGVVSYDIGPTGIRINYMATKRPGLGRQIMRRVADAAAARNLPIRLETPVNAAQFFRGLGMTVTKSPTGETQATWTPGQMRAFLKG